MLITRKVEFSASHICAAATLSAAENRALFGPEAGSHGHNYTLEVTLSGQPDPVTGMVMDLKLLKAILQREIVDCFDHRFLNHEVPPFDHLVPTPENIALEIWRRLAPRLNGDGCRLHSVRLWETSDLFVDYFGEAA